MNRYGMGFLRRNVRRSSFSTHAEKVGSRENPQAREYARSSTGFFEQTTPIPQSDKTEYLLKLEDASLAKVRKGSNEIKSVRQSTNCNLYYVSTIKKCCLI